MKISIEYLLCKVCNADNYKNINNSRVNNDNTANNIIDNDDDDNDNINKQNQYNIDRKIPTHNKNNENNTENIKIIYPLAHDKTFSRRIRKLRNYFQG